MVSTTQFKKFNYLQEKLIFLFLILVFMSGCSSTSNLNNYLDQFNYEVIEGKTTKAEIRQIFGPPDSVSVNDQGLEIYIYTNAEELDGTMVIDSKIFYKKKYTKKKLLITFNKESIVKKMRTY